MGDSGDRADDIDDGQLARMLTVVLGLYLLAGIVLLRAAYRLRRSSPGTPSPSGWLTR